MSKHERALEAAIEAADVVWSTRERTREDAWSAGIAAYLAVMREPGPGEVRVRACVAVNTWADGGDGYNVAGWSGANDVANKRMARDCRCGDQPEPQYRWLEGNVLAWAPVPEPTVEGEVTG